MHIPIRLVLVETSHPGNIGAAARAMKTMGVSELTLVAPKHFPSDEATARASGADELLEQASVVASLPDAITDCGYVIGASARLRGMRWPVLDPRTFAQSVWQRLKETKVALVMGPEQSGLTNDDLARCDALVHIPANPEYGSLNVAMAVQVLCYELRMAEPANRLSGPEEREAPLATAAELEGFHLHLERVLSDIGFLHPDHPKQLKLRLRRLFGRAQLDQNEINILRGALTALDPAARKETSHR